MKYSVINCSTYWLLLADECVDECPQGQHPLCGSTIPESRPLECTEANDVLSIVTAGVLSLVTFDGQRLALVLRLGQSGICLCLLDGLRYLPQSDLQWVFYSINL